MNSCIGKWIGIAEMEREIEIGDLIIIDTLIKTTVEEVFNTEEERLFNCYDEEIPRNRILAVKMK